MDYSLEAILLGAMRLNTYIMKKWNINMHTCILLPSRKNYSFRNFQTYYKYQKMTMLHLINYNSHYYKNVDLSWLGNPLLSRFPNRERQSGTKGGALLSRLVTPTGTKGLFFLCFPFLMYSFKFYQTKYYIFPFSVFSSIICLLRSFCLINISLNLC